MLCDWKRSLISEGIPATSKIHFTIFCTIIALSSFSFTVQRALSITNAKLGVEPAAEMILQNPVYFISFIFCHRYITFPFPRFFFGGDGGILEDF